MKSRFSKIAIIVSCVISLTTTSASAYVMPVIDAANLSQTAITAYEQVLAYAMQVKQFKEQINSNLNKLKSLESASGKEMAQAIAGSLLGYAEQLEGTLKDQREIADTLKYWYGASKKSPEQFMRDLASQYKAGDQRVSTLMDHYQANGAAMMEAHRGFQEMATAIQSINGPTEGLQAVNTSIGILIKQQASLMSLKQLDTLKEAEEQAKKNQSLKGLTDYESNYQKRLDAAK